MAIRGSACALLIMATLGCGGEEFQSGGLGSSRGANGENDSNHADGAIDDVKI